MIKSTHTKLYIHILKQILDSYSLFDDVDKLFKLESRKKHYDRIIFLSAYLFKIIVNFELIKYNDKYKKIETLPNKEIWKIITDNKKNINYLLNEYFSEGLANRNTYAWSQSYNKDFKLNKEKMLIKIQDTYKIDMNFSPETMNKEFERMKTRKKEKEFIISTHDTLIMMGYTANWKYILNYFQKLCCYLIPKQELIIWVCDISKLFEKRNHISWYEWIERLHCTYKKYFLIAFKQLFKNKKIQKSAKSVN